MVQKMRKKIGRLSMPELYINKWFHKTEVGTVYSSLLLRREMNSKSMNSLGFYLNPVAGKNLFHVNRPSDRYRFVFLVPGSFWRCTRTATRCLSSCLLIIRLNVMMIIIASWDLTYRWAMDSYIFMKVRWKVEVSSRIPFQLNLVTAVKTWKLIAGKCPTG